jgi:hypothetical protein
MSFSESFSLYSSLPHDRQWGDGFSPGVGHFKRACPLQHDDHAIRQNEKGKVQVVLSKTRDI